MSATDPVDSVLHELALDARSMTRSAINGVRTALGISGAVAVILGAVLLFWPEKTLAKWQRDEHGCSSPGTRWPSG